MTAFTEPAGSRSSNIAGTALNSLTNGSYSSGITIDLSAVDPDDCVIEVEATPGIVSSLKQLSIWLQVSFDGTNYSTGGTSSTDEPVLYPLGALPLPANSTLQRKAFSVLAALGFVPPYCKVITKNETGATLASSGHAIYYTCFTGLGT